MSHFIKEFLILVTEEGGLNEPCLTTRVITMEQFALLQSVNNPSKLKSKSNFLWLKVVKFVKQRYCCSNSGNKVSLVPFDTKHSTNVKFSNKNFLVYWCIEKCL